MKCSRCGNEFGSGSNCQSCGVDRVTGLANYGGYDGPAGTNGDDPDGGFSKTMVCYACGEIIPANSEYCPYCSKELYVMCPKCGHKYSSQFPACNKCGTNREEFNEGEKKREAEKEKEQIIINDALKLKGELRSKIGYVIIGLSTVLGVIVSVTLFHNIIGSGGNIIGDIVLDIIRGGIFGLLLGGGIVNYTIDLNKRNREIINKWKKEHPNDPRCKYL